VGAEELSFPLKGFFNWHIVIDVLLRPALASVVAKLQGVNSTTQQFKRIGALIH
jgi:hypothetical protein